VTAQAAAPAIAESVHDFYKSYPFPQLTATERRRQLPFEICKYKFLGIDHAMRGARVLDVGCGTARHMLLMKHFGVGQYVGLDHSPASLAIAQQVAQEEGFDRFQPLQGDLFKLPFSDNSFDVVVSWGVLHHTPDPFRGLAEMVRVCRKGGFVAVFLYNRWNHWKFNRQKQRILTEAGDSMEARFQLAQRLYGTKPVEQMSKSELLTFYDRYCHPYKSDHSYGEILGWFDTLGLEYWGSSRPARFRDFVRYLQELNHQVKEQTARDESRGAAIQAIKAARLASKLPKFGAPSGPFRRPSVLHNFVWQAALAWQGRSGRASHSTSFSARKR
jgi:ubiquinone/menaquinone biosynthesis C-methylase UbiE